MQHSTTRRWTASVSALTLGAAITFAMAGAATAQQLGSYRVETEDCVGCGSQYFETLDDAISYIDYVRNHMDAVNANATAGTTTTGGDGEEIEFEEEEEEEGQVIFLDFDAGGLPTFPVCRSNGTLFGVFQDHVYTPAERRAITRRVAADYGDFDFEVVRRAPEEGPYTTIFFGQNDAPLDCSGGSNITVFSNGGLSILFGRADGIDFLNANKSDTAFADASLWEFLAQLDPSGGLFEAFSGVSVADFGGDLDAALSYAVVNQSSNTGAHEAGHIVGLRHQNSFGAPGDGLPSTGRVSPFEFVPVFTGGSNATETVLHTMASGASVGLSLSGSTITDRFFSERSAARLAIAESAPVVAEASLRNDTISLRPIEVPNTIITGVNANTPFYTEATVVEGAIEFFGDTDSYYFQGTAGEFFNAELISVIGLDLSFVDGIMGQLRLYEVAPNGTETLVAANLQSYESLFDAEIFDAVLPSTGTYRLEVSAPNEIYFFDFTGDGVLDPLPLTLVGGGDLLVGQYAVQVYTAVAALDDDAEEAEEAEEEFELAALDD